MLAIYSLPHLIYFPTELPSQHRTPSLGLDAEVLTSTALFVLFNSGSAPTSLRLLLSCPLLEVQSSSPAATGSLPGSGGATPPPTTATDDNS
jgi:hypothetical protein